jgi:membrane fusion protein (multidrug efflux system)
MPSPAARKRLLIIVILLMVLGGGIYFLFTLGKETTDDASIEANVAPIASKISGYVTKLHIADNQKVKAGDVLLEIDPADYEIRLHSAKAALEAARGRLETSTQSFESTKISAPSNLESVRAQLEAAQANWQKAANDLKRIQSLDPMARSKQQLDAVIAQEKTARAELEDVKAKLRSAQTAPRTIAGAQASVRELEAQVAKAQADVDQAQNDLDNTQVLAPFDGQITKRGVELGAYVQPGQQLMALVSADYWVIANFKETQLEKMKAGQEADIKIDAYPDKHYKAKVDSVQTGTGTRFSAFPPENATGNFVKIVQRVPVKLVFTERPDAALSVGPGMSVEPTVMVK